MLVVASWLMAWACAPKFDKAFEEMSEWFKDAGAAASLRMNQAQDSENCREGTVQYTFTFPVSPLP